MIGMLAVGPDQRHHDTAQTLIVTTGHLAARCYLLVQMAKPHRQNRRVKLIEPAVLARDIAVVMLKPAILADGPALFRERRVISDHGAAVSERAQILGRIETEGRDIA